MKIYLKDFAFYGKWYSEDENEYEILAWLEKSSFQFFLSEDLIEEFGYKNCE